MKTIKAIFRLLALLFTLLKVWLYGHRRQIAFWLVWIFAAPLVWLFFLWSDTVNRRFYAMRCGVMTGLVRQDIWDRFVLQKEARRQPEFQKRARSQRRLY